MRITKQVLKNAKDGFDIIARTGRSVYVQMRDNDPRYIDFIVEKGNPYYCAGDNAYVYWDGAVYGFSFGADLFEVTP